MGCKPSGTRSEEFRFFAHNDLSGPLVRLSAGPEITWHGSLSADIYWVRFDPALGVKIQKIRPALIVQNDVANRHSPETIVAAITSRYQEPLCGHAPGYGRFLTEIWDRISTGGDCC